jgi:glycosyltransferase involved in cell wall biosynthesis
MTWYSLKCGWTNNPVARALTAMQVSILNAGGPTDYLYGFVTGLSPQPGMQIEVVDGDTSQALFTNIPNVRHFNLRGDNRSPQSFLTKTFRIFFYYIRLLKYVARTRSRVFHIQWDNSFLLFDRTLLLLYYKIYGKKIAYTAHNISKEARDGVETWYHRTSLYALYRLVDSIIVHTEQMKNDLIAVYKISANKIYVVRHGINLLVPKTGLTPLEARRKLGISESAHVVLFFGYIDNYKGTDLLIDAVAQLAKDDPLLVLILAGQFKCSTAYRTSLENHITNLLPTIQIKTLFEFIAPERVEELFIASDCVALPYRRIYQSGVIFLAYRFGIPIVATDVGNFREDIPEGKAGFVCIPNDRSAFAGALQKYFGSELFIEKTQTRARIEKWAEEKYSWHTIGTRTAEIYAEMMKLP